MKKILLFVSVVGMLMVGCSSNEVKTKETTKVVASNSDDRPKWVRVGHGDGFSAVGSYKVGNASEEYAIAQATLAARAKLAAKYSVMVNATVDNTEEVLKSLGTPVNTETGAMVRQEMTRATLVGSSQMDSYYDEKNDKLYVLIGIDEEMAKNQALKKFETALKNDDVMYQKYLAEKKLDKMNSALDKAYNKGLESGPVEE